jgi:stage II sporulation protein D
MFYKYEVINNGVEDILYLYLSMKYEFSNELDLHDNNKLKFDTKNFIKTNNIKFNGNKVFLIIDGIVYKTIILNTDNNKYLIDEEYSSDKFLINIKSDKMYTITLRSYLTSMLLANYKVNINIETLKAICILYNTYAYKMMSENNYIIEDNCFTRYRDINYYKDYFSNYNELIITINKVIDEVNCMYLSYNNKYILPFIHYSNNGKTISNSNYPYLSSVKSLWDLASPYYVEIKDFRYKDINSRLDININCNSNIYVKDKNIYLEDNVYSLEEFKNIFNLKSSDLYIIVNKNSLRFITRGWGNFYGLSIYGANELAKNDNKYFNILKYYFPKTKLCRYTKRLS